MPADRASSFQQRALTFLADRVWNVDLSAKSRVRRFGVHLVRIGHLVFRGFRDNECPLHAAALTYLSLMALVPILALALAILRGLGAGEWAEQKILANVTSMPDQFQIFVANLLGYVRNTNFATLGGVGLVFLLWLAVSMLANVEMSFNRIWGVTVPRRLSRRLSDFISILMVVPLLVVAAATINATLTSPSIMQLVREVLGPAAVLYLQGLSLMPLVVIWVAFMFLYKFMPNTRVENLPAIFSGMIGGSLWIGWQKLYLAFQIGVSQYNAIYATLASVFVFLFWLYISWQIVLLGAEMGFAFQNYATYKMELRAHRASVRSKIMLALSVLSHAGQSMMINVPYFEVAVYARLYRVPVRLINEVLEELVAAGFLAEVADGSGQFVLVKPPDTIRVNDVINVILQSGATPQSLGLDHLNPAIRNLLGKMDTGAAEALKDFSLTDLLQLHARLATNEQP